MTVLSIIRDGEYYLIDEAPAPKATRGLYFISDTMPLTQHMANGKHYDSKSEFRKATKAAGCIEVGDHKFTPRKPIVLDKHQRAMDIKRTIEQLRSR